MKPGELERRVTRLVAIAARAQGRLGELMGEMREVRRAMDELAQACREPGAGAVGAGNGTSGPEVPQAEAAYK